jgi:hypothetical protein
MTTKKPRKENTNERLLREYMERQKNSAIPSSDNKISENNSIGQPEGQPDGLSDNILSVFNKDTGNYNNDI